MKAGPPDLPKQIKSSLLSNVSKEDLPEQNLLITYSEII